MQRILLLPLFVLLFACKKHKDPPPVANTKEITYFALKAANNPGVIAADVVPTYSGDTIRFTLSESVPLNNLVPTIEHNGVSLSPASGVAQDFSNPVHYVVTGRDGSRRSYIVVVSRLSAVKSIVSFQIRSADNPAISKDITATISGDSIYFEADAATVLKPTIVFTGLSIYPGTDAWQDFSDPVAYVVTAADGTSRIYTVLRRNNDRVYFGSNDGYAYALERRSGSLVWKYATGGAVQSSPAFYNARVYITTTNGYLHCLDAKTGNLIWTAGIPSGGTSTSPFVQDDVVYITSGKGYGLMYDMHAFNANTGAVIWSRQLGSSMLASPVVAGDLVYAGDTEYGMYAVNKTNGNLVWNYGAGIIKGGAVVSNGNIYFVSERNTLLILDAATGTLKATYGRGVVSVGELTISNGTIYICNLTELLAVDSATLTLKWTLTSYGGGMNGTGYFSAPVVENGIVYAGNNDGHLYAVDAASGSIKWTTPGGVLPDVGAVNPTVSNGTVYCGHHDGHLYAYDAITGSIKWSFATDGAVYSGPCVTGPGAAVAYPGYSGYRN